MTRLITEAKAPARASIELGDVTHHNLKQLKKINTVVLPVSYNDKFYLDVLESGELAKLAYYNDVVVGAVCSRIDNSENMRRLYIMTLGCLYPYRRLGIGTVMVQHILNCVERDGNFDSIFLHVKVDNKGAIEFYKRFGFEIVETKQHYYKRIEPADAHVLQKTLTKKAAAATASAANQPSASLPDANQQHVDEQEEAPTGNGPAPVDAGRGTGRVEAAADKRAQQSFEHSELDLATNPTGSGEEPISRPPAHRAPRCTSSYPQEGKPVKPRNRTLSLPSAGSPTGALGPLGAHLVNAVCAAAGHLFSRMRHTTRSGTKESPCFPHPFAALC